MNVNLARHLPLPTLLLVKQSAVRFKDVDSVLRIFESDVGPQMCPITRVVSALVYVAGLVLTW